MKHMPPLPGFPESSPLEKAYDLLGAKTPLELSQLYTVEDQKLFKSHEWDYENPNLITNQVKMALEAVDVSHLNEAEQEWSEEILWFWYHHAISCAIWKKDLKAAKEFAKKALEHQSESHPNKITYLLYLLVNDEIEEAELWLKTIPVDSIEVDTAQYLIDEYKKHGSLVMVE
jgi:hypothetical protein